MKKKQVHVARSQKMSNTSKKVYSNDIMPPTKLVRLSVTHPVDMAVGADFLHRTFDINNLNDQDPYILSRKIPGYDNKMREYNESRLINIRATWRPSNTETFPATTFMYYSSKDLIGVSSGADCEQLASNPLTSRKETLASNGSGKNTTTLSISVNPDILVGDKGVYHSSELYSCDPTSGPIVNLYLHLFVYNTIGKNFDNGVEGAVTFDMVIKLYNRRPQGDNGPFALDKKRTALTYKERFLATESFIAALQEATKTKE